ncbi:hypothetical protein C1E23_04550 [Pseudoalteromonas phenolica]|uniref:DUF417 domain-containing protein n=1 Tax=Pseudoalteromonas phenolica TaxID=161398 RepID=A0A4Q7IRT0_9GAMM|nr:DUF417 family protein [Pseudoalteromonas phenolica]RZQ54246.1 hypothetical protein C1E23_04550 [Pseudoalteromonas phenolica]
MKKFYCNTNVAFLLVGLSSILMSTSMLLIGSHRHIEKTVNFFGFNSLLSYELANMLAALCFSLLAVFSILSMYFEKAKPALASLLIVVSVVPLLSLFSTGMWIESMGGFPVIGAGQGVIKYFALLSIGICLLNPNLSQYAMKWIAILPVLVVLVWIGGMKFTLIEAQGIEDLLQTSPFMSWMYSVWDLQTASNLIGVYDLLAVALLIAAIYNKKVLWIGVLMSLAVFIMTQTFLATTPGAVTSSTILSTTGHFLIKDLWFIANLIFFLKFTEQKV